MSMCLRKRSGRSAPFTFKRRDVVEQAVSWARAEQSAYWQHGDEVQAQPRLDIDHVHGLVGTIHEHNAGWQAWFGAQGVEPLGVEYESLASDPEGTVERSSNGSTSRHRMTGSRCHPTSGREIRSTPSGFSATEHHANEGEVVRAR